MEDVVVVGAGIVGLATARALLMARPDLRVVVVDKADEVGTAQTGHNSGVIHAGLYYAPGSLKARLCRAGARATTLFCEEHGIPHRAIGKLVVATDRTDLDRLEALQGRSTENGIPVRCVSRAELAEMEPLVTGLGAVHSPSTGIVDFRLMARAMAGDVVARGGTVLLRSAVRSISESGGASPGVLVETDTGWVRARYAVACAGLQADRVARLAGLDVDFRIVPFRGEYYQLPLDRQPVQRLIYPVPDPALPFLGVHLSPTIDGRVTVGPNAVLGLAREGYPRFSVNPRDVASFVAFPGMWRFARRNVRTGATEIKDSVSRRAYLARVRRYCPSVTLDDLRPYPAGIRAQAVDRSGSSVEDFLFRRTARQLHVCNAPSPAATSAIPIGELISHQVLAALD